jgi:hypothetical protein
MLMSLFIPGGGQLYNKQTNKAIIAFCSAPGLIVLSICIAIAGIAASFPPVAFITLLFWIAIPIIWVLQVIDAVLIAGRLNRGEAITSRQNF